MVLTTTTDILIDSSNPNVDTTCVRFPRGAFLQETSGVSSLRTTTTKTVPDARSTGTVVFTKFAFGRKPSFL